MKNTAADQAQQRESLVNAISNSSTMNYAAIIEGFAAKGISSADVIPRENVFTFKAWRALGRSVREGEKGVEIVTFVRCNRRKAGGSPVVDGARATGSMRPVRTHVFHITQTVALNPAATAH